MKISGIYTITNISTGRIYIGSSNDILARWKHHKIKLKSSTHDNTYLQNSWNKYGEDNFKFEILEEYIKELLLAMEHYWCTVLRVHSREFGYNIKPTHPEKTNLCSDETKTRMSAAQKLTWNQERKDYQSSLFKGRINFWKKGKQTNDLIKRRVHAVEKPVYQYSLDGKLIDEWKSAKDVERKLGFTSDYISQNCRGIIKKFKNYIWKYKKDGITKENS